MAKSRHTYRPYLAYLAAAGLALTSGGCLWVAAGAAAGAAVGYIYYQGNVCDLYTANFDDTWAATRTALLELGMPVVSEKRETTFTGVISSRLGDGDAVRIHLETMPAKIPTEGPVTRVCVRVAALGEASISERILSQIDVHLVRAPAPTSPQPPPAIPPAAPTWSSTTPPRPQDLPPSTSPPPLLSPEPAAPKAPSHF